MVIDVYTQYFAGECVFNDVERHGVSVKLTSDSEAGQIRYTVSVSFFPHRDPEDFAVSYDAYAEKEIYHNKGRRSRKREAAMLETFRDEADAVAAELGGTIDWEQPLIEARWG